MYWLDRKHPDFRRPFVHKIDSDDYLQYQRILNEKEQVIRVHEEARRLAYQAEQGMREETNKKIDAWMDMWVKQNRTEKQKAQIKFDEWKKKFLEKNGYKDDSSIT
jgi:hypothetical protein